MLLRLVSTTVRGLSRSATCSSATSVDYYKVLGVKPGASQKEVKAAYYKLSKEHHPDRNQENTEEAARKFHEVSMAYEILGSDEKRKIYDMTRVRTSPMDSMPGVSRKRRSTAPTKQYTDIDIDYKNFEQFQRSTRHRPQFHSHFDMPDEFYAEFGNKSKKRQFKSDYDEAQSFGSMYKDSRATQREEKELQAQIEREQRILQEKYPIPTFEKLLQEKRDKERKQQQQYTAGLLVASAVFAFVFLIIGR